MQQQAAAGAAAALALEVRTKPGEPPLAVSATVDQTVLQLKQQLAESNAGWSADGMNLILQGRYLENETPLGTVLKSGDFVVLTGQVAVVIEAPDIDPPNTEYSSAPPASSTRFPPAVSEIERD
jgi:molybdopterin converting factor small subunit|eukprot:3287467-Prymnesium_polylepis.1